MVLATVVFGGMLSACNWAGPSGATGCDAPTNTSANNNYHTFFYDDLVPESTWSMDLARYEIETSPVDTDTNFSTSADVRVMDAAYTNYCDIAWWTPTQPGYIGLVECDQIDWASQCMRHELRLNRLFMEDEGDPDCRVSLALHESLHTLGLNHLDDLRDVMHEEPAIACVRTLGDHNKGHLDEHYS